MEKIKRDRLVCDLYKAGVPVATISDRAKISVSTLYVILKRHKVTLRQDERKEALNKAVDVICNYFDMGVSPEAIAEMISTDTRNILLVLKKFRYDQLRIYLEKLKQAEATKQSKFKESDPAAQENKLAGLLVRQEKQKLEKNYADLNFNAHIQRAMEGKRGVTDDELRDKKIADEYTSGASIKDILEEFDVSQRHLFYLIEADENKPGYFPDRPPLAP